MNRELLRVPKAAAGMRIGLLGGSFNPPHAAHRNISLAALKRLQLDRVWWLVSPGNPLKQRSELAPLAERVAAAETLASSPRILVTAFEAAPGRSAYTVDTLHLLRRRYPATHFVWLMGADNLATIDRWQSWEELFRLMPIAVLDRPRYRHRALASKAARRFASAYVDESDAPLLPFLVPPAWTFLRLPLSPLSSTEVRLAQKSKP